MCVLWYTFVSNYMSDGIYSIIQRHMGVCIASIGFVQNMYSSLIQRFIP